ncbi:MAG: hypothetical protein HY460_01965 [Parcubacteria group bacterium]|nr:hypothetical protein [Parcubacteria group bacterium]
MYALAGGIALLADSADFVVGWIPIAGDILDVLVLLVIETLFIFRAFFDLKSRALIPIGLIGMACLGELIPVFGDLPPTWIGAVFLAWQLERRYESAKHRFRSLRGRAGMRQLFSPVRSASHEGYTQP